VVVLDFDLIFFFSTISVDKWRVHRRLISPVFNANLLNQFLPVFHQKNEVLIKNLSKEVDKIRPFNLISYIAPTTLDTICGKYIIRI
jgi:cytochrome P450 family 4